MILLKTKHKKAKNKKREDQTMKENKKLGTSNTGAVAEPPIQITDNRKEITELTEAELKELESVTKQFEKGSSEHLKYLRMNFKHIGE